MAEHIGTTCVQGGYRPGDGEPPSGAHLPVHHLEVRHL